jgi:hypothetical protein
LLERLFASRAAWVGLYFAVVAPLLIGTRFGAVPPVAEVGSVAGVDFIAPETREFVDEAATSAVRQAASSAVHPVHAFDTRAAAHAVEALRESFRRWREALEPAGSGRPPRREVLSRLGQVSTIPVSAATLAYLLEIGFDPGAEERLSAILREVLAQRIVGSKSQVPRPGAPLVLRDVRAGREWKEEAPAPVLSLDEARVRARGALRATASLREAEALWSIVQDLIGPNLVFDGALTEARRREAADRVEPLIVRIPKGKILLRRGEVVSEDAAGVLASWRASDRAGVAGKKALGNLLFASLLLFFLSRYVFFYQKTSKKERHLFALMVTAIALCLAIDRGFLWLCDSLAGTIRVEAFSDPALYRSMAPVATGAMLMTLLVNPRVGMAYALFYIPLFGMMMGWDLPLLLFCLTSNLAGIYGITAYRRRTALIKAGILLGGINAAAVLALRSLLGGAPSPGRLLTEMVCGLAGGILVTLLVSFLLPLFEAAFNILTDVRLLELSNLNNPLLRRLAVEAPGSYNHSVIVGTLAEAAAEAVGANALFCRVAAYYHDVGKLLKPSYFVENQKEVASRHDHLSPRMSALVIASHVKEGYELARSYGLPGQVLDIIPQHHGTRRINYFYQKAKMAEKPGTEEVLESDFRYPGPKPQSREAAIFMLADSIEAAARTLDDPSPARFKGLIRTIVSDVVLDDQFDECDLTFSDLEKASAAFLGTLSSIYHHRIDYPGFDFERTPERPFGGSRSHGGAPPRAGQWER